MEDKNIDSNMLFNLAKYNSSNYNPGGIFRRGTWYLTSIVIFEHALIPSSRIKSSLLRLFGAKIGENVVIKPRVRIKYPWFLNVGRNTWIGEEVWIDNLTQVVVGSDCCLSQGAYLLTGNHNYKKPTFDLLLGELFIDDSVWIGAKSVICPGVKIGKGSVVCAGSVVVNDCESMTVFQGNPASSKRARLNKNERIS